MSVIEKKFFRYPFDREIAIRKQELSEKQSDTNIGGGKGNLPSSPVENIVIKEQCDPFILEHQKWRQVIREIYDEASDFEKEVMDIKYFGGQQYIPWKAVAEQVNCSQSKIYKVRYSILERFARKVGHL